MAILFAPASKLAGDTFARYHEKAKREVRGARIELVPAGILESPAIGVEAAIDIDWN